MVTVDTSANKISLKSDNLNVLSDGKATLSANEYEFSANGYIGGLSGTKNNTVDEVIIAVMENYKHIPNSVKTSLSTLNTSNFLNSALKKRQRYVILYLMN